MIKTYTDPWLIDFLKVAAALPQDEREQLEAFTGEPYSIDGCAIGNFTAPGPKWVIKSDYEPIAIGGFVQQRPGVWRDFMLNNPCGVREPLVCRYPHSAPGHERHVPKQASPPPGMHCAGRAASR